MLVDNNGGFILARISISAKGRKASGERLRIFYGERTDRDSERERKLGDGEVPLGLPKCDLSYSSEETRSKANLLPLAINLLSLTVDIPRAIDRRRVTECEREIERGCEMNDDLKLKRSKINVGTAQYHHLPND